MVNLLLASLLGSIKLKLHFFQSASSMPSYMDELPNSVQSVVYDVLREDPGLNLLSNPVSIDECLAK